MRLDRLRRRDIARCEELENVLFPGDSPWTKDVFASEIATGHYYVGVFEGESLLGYAGLSVVGREPNVEAEVHTVGVDPRHQGRGLGRALVRALLARADRFAAETFLEVRTDNEAAITLYEAHGFEHVGVRKRYYQPSGADAYTMRRPRTSAGEEDGDGDG
ncbi:ribosomal-protein-alanine N-acetyltransferase [Allosaccharopolyspora coralli]|uniref:Ribosomal-protein-alanine N-acetyltransferase n=1 Tax=Allosaccharopolyspora coralli TaxID=2665642 RepID=A0A5Q3QLZ5_9PSEU|nr:ribosomal protein S18-alanine N-acetyltransferase [Allosaccharopolyspora coralli]QGK72439.1 ribosomal-protein-alanine N-acetyltransferase [Allosaccharopolyspora coralli]